MTPADLELLLHELSVAVLTEHDLDAAVVPATVAVERPRNPEHGDYATNIALRLAKQVGTNPRDLAGWLAAGYAAHPAIGSAEVAGPGFINLRLDAASQNDIVTRVLDLGERYGSSDELAGSTINLEFVSANPTGPVHLGGVRWAAVGDTLGRILAFSGAAVIREYYFNDHGTQIDKFALSLDAAARGVEGPENGYRGDYILEYANRVVDEVPGILDLPEAERVEAFRAHGVQLMFDHVKRSLADFGTEFDVFTHEDKLFEDGLVDQVITQLKEQGDLYENEGAWWLRSTNYGDDRDRVVLRSDGHAAYIAGDIAYIKDKHDRGATLSIYMLGADHHGYIKRLKASAAALGYSPDAVEVLIGQMVNLVRDGQPIKMSKRAGNIISLDDLVAAVGVDAGRYAMLRSSVDVNLDVDLDLMAKQSNENPVYYVQYAHARLAALARNAAELSLAPSTAHLDLLDSPAEGQLIRSLGDFPGVVATAATLREPHRVARYLESLAADYHKFYAECRVLPQGDEQPTDLHAARLALCAATRQVLATGLNLVGVSAPERM